MSSRVTNPDAVGRHPVDLVTRLTWLAAGWALLYAAYRGYYAVGGTAALPGVLASGSALTFRWINAIAAALLVAGAVAPFVMAGLWRTRLRALCIVAAWAAAVGCVMHALIDIAQRVLSLAGIIEVRYPRTLWASVNHRAADLQDLIGNEPWFLIEGVLLAALCLLRLGRRGRRLFLITSGAAVALAVAVGLLSTFGSLPRVVIG